MRPSLYLLMLLSLPSTALPENCREKPFWFSDEACSKATLEDTSMQVEKTYSALVKGADNTRRPMLIAAHEAWRDYRMKQCGVEFDLTRIQHSRYSEHGTTAPSYERSCLIRLNDTRLIELNALSKRS